jgi:GNAT superfamily N-acetyltransferase
MPRLVTTTSLDMTRRDALRPARPSAIPFQLVQVEMPCPEVNRCLYTAVGAHWWWYSRLSWDDARWLAYLDRPELETWVAYVSGTPDGYFELGRQHAAAVELVYFGLVPRFIGKGIGGTLLTAAINRAWEMGAQRVWLHTCTLDHPQPLANDQARGFRIVRREEMVEELPKEPLRPWPGANFPCEDRDASHHLIVDMPHDCGAQDAIFDRAGIGLSMIQRAIGPTASVLAAARKAGVPISRTMVPLILRTGCGICGSASEKRYKPRTAPRVRC